jgi:hypothetical protein
MGWPYPTWLGPAAGGAANPVTTQFMIGAYTADMSAIFAVYGSAGADQWLHRASVNGPPGSTCALYVGNLDPAVVMTDPRYLVDSTPAGDGDYGCWVPPINVPNGYAAIFTWTGGLVGFPSPRPTGLPPASVRIDIQRQPGASGP